ncbi:MAG TPA: FG-GAP-like repeat-containing protein, partial [Usitatibacteraceae bacterium]|nr:FG-GAP-like repeat-containing protein [Usitatibacteraceae bacterium]
MLASHSRFAWFSVAALAWLSIAPGAAFAVAPPVGTQVAIGVRHSCLVDASGAARCWGSNAYGELGDGTTTYRTTPVAVSGLSSGVVAVSVGAGHSCALTQAGGVKCWGNNSFGQLGDGSTTDRSTPVDVSGLTGGVAAISGEGLFSCALTAAGGVKCWGYNGTGQLGDGTTTTRLAPVAVSGLASGVAMIGTGPYHACAISTDGTLRCWGQNNYGQLGDGTTTHRTAPVVAAGLAGGVVAVDGGDFHTCAITAAGGLKCWGYNIPGQLGDGTMTTRMAPVDVSGLTSGVATVGTGGSHTCATTTTGAALCWGANNFGQLGDGTTTNRLVPTAVTGMQAGVASIVGSNGEEPYSCALTRTGGAYCWGRNLSGQLGDGTTTNRPVPTGVSGAVGGVASVAGGGLHTCARTPTGGAECWGGNMVGQLGDGSTSDRLAPVAVSGLAVGVESVHAGGNHSCALVAGGAKCWGLNSNGQLGDGTGTNRLTAVSVSGLTSGVAGLATGTYHTCAVTSAGGAKCWGLNTNGQLGDGTTSTRYTAGDVSGLTSGVAAVAAGHYHSCALTTEGGVKCWGKNSVGQLGDDTTTTRLAPVDVTGLTSGVVAIAVGTDHTCAVTTGGGLKCWGGNLIGQLGDGTTTSRDTPVDVSGLASGVVAVSPGNYHTCALLDTGGVKCWGYNDFGQVGDGTTTSRSLPTDVAHLFNDAEGLEAGYQHNCVVTAAGSAACWGSNDFGQLGDGTTTQRTAPVLASGTAGQWLDFAPPVHAPWNVPVSLTAAASSGLAPGFDSWTPETCTVSGGTATPVAAQGVCGVRARQAGEGGYRAAPDVLRLIVLDKAAQSINFETIADRVLSDGAFTVSPTASSGLTVTLASATPGTCSVTGFTITPLADGPCVIDADQPGDAGYAPAPTVTRTFIVLGDTTPEAFSFTPVADVAPGTQVTSGAAGITGINAPAPVFVVGGQYSVGCAEPYTSEASTIANGQTVCVRHVASAGYATQVTTTLTIGGVSADFTSTTVAAPVVATRGDANGDGMADLYWRDASGGLSWWTMNGASATAANYHDVDPAWQIADVGDLDGDGKADLVWRRASDGATYLWLLDGFVFKGFADLGVLDPAAWTLVGTADLDGDGKDDVVWRGADGTVYGWLMNG